MYITVSMREVTYYKWVRKEMIYVIKITSFNIIFKYRSLGRSEAMG